MMIRPIIHLFIFSFFIILSSCENKETPAKPYNRGGLTISTIDMGSNYNNQHYYDLGSGKIVKSNLKTDWDFSFTCDGSNLVELNTSRNMLAANTGSTNFDQNFDTAGVKFKMDFPGGNPDSLAIGNIKDNSHVYMVSMGYDLLGNDLGFIKIQFTHATNGTISFIYGPLKGSEKNVGTLAPSIDYNRVFYSTIKKKAVQIEPQKKDYDLLFTQYLYFFLEPEITPYLVAGVLLNPFKTSAAKVDGKTYSKVTLSDTIVHQLTTKRDIMGYDWKVFSIDKNQYTIIPNRSFIIHDAEGFFFKLRFVDFYNDMGIKGHPKFEFVKL